MRVQKKNGHRQMQIRRWPPEKSLDTLLYAISRLAERTNNTNSHISVEKVGTCGS